MRLSEILTSHRILVAPSGEAPCNGDAVLRSLAELLARGGPCNAQGVYEQLAAREKLQSTGIGEGVAIPHTSLGEVEGQRAALVLCPGGIDFDSIDREPVTIFFAVIGPKSAAGAHLKILAKISRLLRSPETRRRLLESTGPMQAYSLIEEHDAASIES